VVKNYQIAFDLDDVIFETTLPLLIECQRRGWISSDFKFEDIVLPTFYQLFGWKRGTHEFELLTSEFIASLKVHQQVIDTIKNLMKNNISVCYITSRPISLARTTFEVLDKMGLRWEDVFLALTDEKANFAKQMEVRIVVDDRPQVALSAGRIGLCACVPEMPYNQQILKVKQNMDIYRGNWAYLEKIINKKMEKMNER